MNCRFVEQTRCKRGVWIQPRSADNRYPRSIPDNSGCQIRTVARSKAGVCVPRAWAWALSKLTRHEHGTRVVYIFPDCTTTVVCGCVNRSQSKYICTHRRNAARRTHCDSWCNRVPRASRSFDILFAPRYAQSAATNSAIGRDRTRSIGSCQCAHLKF